MPRIRAAQSLNALLALERLGVDERVFTRLRPGTLAAIQSASPLGWLPIELDIELAEAVVDALGPNGGRATARAATLLSFESLLLRFFVGVQKIFELEPASLIAQAPWGWRAVYRDAGRMSYTISPGCERVLVYSEAPALVIENHVYLEAIAGAFEAIFELCRVDGSVTVDAVEPTRGRAELRFSWY
ncbi:MAG TPA: hypothetical protein VM869_05655 [Enhygromyxa sp.]|nr:hypothetical protein [Enhygromyxa sp.]